MTPTTLTELCERVLEDERAAIAQERPALIDEREATLARALTLALKCIDNLRSEDLKTDDCYIRDFDAAIAALEVGS